MVRRVRFRGWRSVVQHHEGKGHNLANSPALDSVCCKGPVRGTVEVEFWGVRGSIASAGSRTSRYGGNTTCLEVNTPDGLFIVDAGTGIRALGNRMMADGIDCVHILFTHCHWDHIQGVPFFSPFYDPKMQVNMVAAAPTMGAGSLERILAAQMQPPTFPVPWDVMPSQRIFHDLGENESYQIGETTVSWVALTHPNEVVAYRFDHGETSMIFCTDTEHPPGGPDPRLVDFARGADMLIYDAQYTPEEYEERKGFGHSTWPIGIAAADSAGVESLVLTHHDPDHDDRFLDQLAKVVGKERPGTILAREGLRLTVGGNGS
ncbi:MAG TPA: MBL fold metallo-hydrolase [Myxococcales bacterium]|nr:MBL fold metallo-hydrolase [Myxococcales bacterium]